MCWEISWGKICAPGWQITLPLDARLPASVKSQQLTRSEKFSCIFFSNLHDSNMIRFDSIGECYIHILDILTDVQRKVLECVYVAKIKNQKWAKMYSKKVLKTKKKSTPRFNKSIKWTLLNQWCWLFWKRSHPKVW